ncbi:hypothetical protein CRG98_041657 [Punica granatum]|uniref:Uncharacterized protein n=1 Tax=Punica granatum TaxID=22663 RepID=A0A2I0I1S9_PUNGR|nr:hypothetical protein CRG98_041657 [Punica granatum]
MFLWSASTYRHLVVDCILLYHALSKTSNWAAVWYVTHILQGHCTPYTSPYNNITNPHDLWNTSVAYLLTAKISRLVRCEELTSWGAMQGGSEQLPPLLTRGSDQRRRRFLRNGGYGREGVEGSGGSTSGLYRGQLGRRKEDDVAAGREGAVANGEGAQWNGRKQGVSETKTSLSQQQKPEQIMQSP